MKNKHINKINLKKLFIAITILITTILSLLIGQTVFASTGSFRTGDKPFIICIDPGHGGLEEGAIYEYGGDEIMEKDLNLSIALALRDELLTYKNVEVIMTREKDIKVEPQDRADIALAGNADLFISIHNNANPDKPSRGCMVLCDVSNYQAPGAKTPDNYMVSGRVGNFILDNLTAKGLLISNDMDEYGGCDGIVRRPYSPDGGASKTEEYPDGSIADFYYQLRFTSEYGIPGVVIEHAYLSNSDDYNSFLSSEDKLAELALCDAAAIAESFHLVKEGEN